MGCIVAMRCGASTQLVANPAKYATKHPKTARTKASMTELLQLAALLLVIGGAIWALNRWKTNEAQSTPRGQRALALGCVWDGGSTWTAKVPGRGQWRAWVGQSGDADAGEPLVTHLQFVGNRAAAFGYRVRLSNRLEPVIPERSEAGFDAAMTDTRFGERERAQTEVVERVRAAWLDWPGEPLPERLSVEVEGTMLSVSFESAPDQQGFDSEVRIEHVMALGRAILAIDQAPESAC
jgi:hypothetical protein